MNNFKTSILCFLMLTLFASCADDKKRDKAGAALEEQVVSSSTAVSKDLEVGKINTQLCENFPSNLIMSYNRDAIRLDIEPVQNPNGQQSYCKLKLFYGEKEYNYWEGQIGSYADDRDDPFWQYSPERNPSLYHKVEGFGEKAVFISNTYQLLILKNGIVYDIIPPNNGSSTNSGKETKEIALEIARFYKL